MPKVPHNLSDCCICLHSLVEPDKEVALKNTGGYIVQLHPDQGNVLHLYHFDCVKQYFDSQLSQYLPTRCIVDQIDINGHELVSIEIDERVNGTNFFAISSDLSSPAHP